MPLPCRRKIGFINSRADPCTSGGRDFHIQVVHPQKLTAGYPTLLGLGKGDSGCKVWYQVVKFWVYDVFITQRVKNYWYEWSLTFRELLSRFKPTLSWVFLALFLPSLLFQDAVLVSGWQSWNKWDPCLPGVGCDGSPRCGLQGSFNICICGCKKKCVYINIYIYVYICIPGTQMTSIFEGQSPQTRPFKIKKRVMFRVPGIYVHLDHLSCLCLVSNLPKTNLRKTFKTNAHLTFFHLSHHLQALQPPQEARPWSYDRKPPPLLEVLGINKIQGNEKRAPGCLGYLGIISQTRLEGFWAPYDSHECFAMKTGPLVICGIKGILSLPAPSIFFKGIVPPSYVDIYFVDIYFLPHFFRIPSLNNQYFMESIEGRFFFEILDVQKTSFPSSTSAPLISNHCLKTYPLAQWTIVPILLMGLTSWYGKYPIILQA